RVDGAQVVQMIRDLAMRTPVIMMSGYRDAPHHALKLDIDAYIPKPFEFPVLFSVVEDCIKNAQRPNDKVPLPA
ncbi:MAG: response regulator, partial [Chloroflexia bacterium]